MTEHGNKSAAGLAQAGITTSANVYWNLTPAELVEHTLRRGEGVLADTGALTVDTGKFTGRAPDDKFWVKDQLTEDHIWWGPSNLATTTEVFDKALAGLQGYVADKDLYVRDVFACADPQYQLKVRVIATQPMHSMFANNMFIRPTAEQLADFTPDYTVVCAPGFEADPATIGTRNPNFAILNLSRRMVVIGGTGYTGEIKKGIFSALNFLLPVNHNVLPMHCSANVGQAGDVAIFFGLSGTGKTTLSADPGRKLIGDDEHGWTNNGVFNFEGGCYAKTINISRESEPEIWDAIKFGAIVENTRFFPGTRTIDYSNKEVTENTRVSYPLHHIPNAVEPSMGGHPKHIFFLAADAYGVLPPISKLTPGQAMFHFLSGYTSKLAGTEVGIKEPKTVFSTCFGAPFMPLHPTVYATMLGERMKEHNVSVWLVNTGWSGGAYGTGSRMKLAYTRAMITAAMTGELDNVTFENHPVFGMAVPQTCPNVPDHVLNPRQTWANAEAYDAQANKLAEAFLQNFQKFEDHASPEIMAGAPHPLETAAH